MTRLFLVGPRGAGKTTVARLAAAGLGWAWVDMDDEIERRAGRGVAAIFATDGEPAFRALEADVLADMCGRERLVIATGGGAVLDAGGRARMRESGFVVWLHAPAAVLWGRIRGDARRPDLAGGGLGEVEAILARREALYRECAHAAVDTSACPAEEAAARALAALAAAPSPSR